MGGLVLFVIALMALFEWALEPLMISLQRLFTLRELICSGPKRHQRQTAIAGQKLRDRATA